MSLPGEDWNEFLTRLAKAEGIENPTDEDQRRCSSCYPCAAPWGRHQLLRRGRLRLFHRRRIRECGCIR